MKTVWHAGFYDGFESAIIFYFVVHRSDIAVWIFHSVSTKNLHRIFSLPVVQGNISSIDKVAKWIVDLDLDGEDKLDV